MTPEDLAALRREPFGRLNIQSWLRASYGKGIVRAEYERLAQSH